MVLVDFRADLDSIEGDVNIKKVPMYLDIQVLSESFVVGVPKIRVVLRFICIKGS